MKSLRLPAALVAVLLSLPSFAQTPPQLGPVIDGLFAPLRALPFPNCGASSWSTAVDALRNGLTAPANGWRSSSNACGLQMYIEQVPASGVPTNAALYIVFDKGLKISDIPGLKGNKWKNIGDAVLTRPIFSVASIDRTMKTEDAGMPASLRGLFGAGTRYAGLQEFTVPIGPQLFTHAAVKGTIGNTLKSVLNAPVDNLWIRSGFAAESPSDLFNREGSKYLEILMPPGTTLSGPLGITEARVSDATIFVDDAKNIALMGNMSFESAAKGKVFPMVVDLPATPVGGVDWTKAQMALATPPVITMEEFAKVSMALNTQVMGGGLLMDTAPAQAVMTKITSLFKPLSTFKLTNPNPQFRLRAGAAYPDHRLFNFVVLSKEAKAKDGSERKGPVVRVRAGLQVLGKQLAMTDTDLSKSGLKTNSAANFTMNLPKVGNYGFTASAIIDVSDAKQDIFVKGSFNTPVVGRQGQFTYNANEISFHSPATCVVPVRFGAKLPLAGDPSVESIVSGLVPVGVDIDEMVGCSQQALEAAAQWAATAGIVVGKGISDAAKTSVQTMAQVGTLFKSGTWKEPNRQAFDCSNFDPKAGPEAAAFINAYPPGRIWGSRDDNPANFRRFIFVESEGRFRQLAGTHVLGGTQCGGLVGEGGIGYTFPAPDKDLWAKVVMCQNGKLPPALISTQAPIISAQECYAVRGLTKLRPDLAGKVVQATGDDTASALLIGPDGIGRFVGSKDKWTLYNECGLDQRYGKLKVTLADFYQIRLAPALTSASQCPQVMGNLWTATATPLPPGLPPPPAQPKLPTYTPPPPTPAQAAAQKLRGRFMSIDCPLPKNTYLIGNDGKRHWIANKDKWVVYEGCKTAAGVTCVSMGSADFHSFMAIPEGAPIPTAAICNGLK